MTKQTLMVITDILIEEQPTLNLEELCVASQVTPEFIQDLFEHGILEMQNEMQEFTADHLRRVRTVVRLQHDLEINLPGAALVLDLMDEIEEMRKQLDVMQDYFSHGK